MSKATTPADLIRIVKSGLRGIDGPMKRVELRVGDTWIILDDGCTASRAKHLETQMLAFMDQIRREATAKEAEKHSLGCDDET